jgi:hypothetical protein
MRPAAKSGRPGFFFGFSNRIAMTPLLTVSHDDAFCALDGYVFNGLSFKVMQQHSVSFDSIFCR